MTLALTIDTAGKLRSSDPGTTITYNTPFPCPNGTPGVTGRMNGVVLHTMAGTLDGAISVFNNAARQASAHLGITQAGRIHQWGPLGTGWEAWHAYAANRAWYGIETEDMGHPRTPISDAALTAWAQCLEFLARFAGFPLQVTNSCNGRGLAYHRMCEEWNTSHHSCPGESFSDMVRVNQRGEIVHRALMIRDPAPVPPAEPFAWTADGHTTGRQVAQRHGVHFDDITWHTALRSPEGYGRLAGPYIRAGRFDDPVPSGTRLWIGAHPR